MAGLKPKGPRLEVAEGTQRLYDSDVHNEINQLGGRSLVYGMNGNLYQPVSTNKIDDKDLVNVREQMIRYGVPIGWESELEVEEDSPLMDSRHHANEVVAKANQHIREYLRQQSIDKGWRQYRFRHLVCHKGDPSLRSGGREFIFAPMTPEFARATGAYGVFTETFNTYRWIGHHSPNAGGHMHMPMGIFSDQQLVLYYKLMEFFADARMNVEGHPDPERAARFLQIIGQRQLRGSWAEWYRIPTVAQYWAIFGEPGNRRDINRYGGRRFIVEKSRHGTIEHRFPRATYSGERALMRSSFLNAAYMYTFVIEQHAYEHPEAFYMLYDLDNFVDFVNQRGDRWPELKRYLRRNYNGISCVTSRNKDRTVKEDAEAYTELFVRQLDPAMVGRRP
jgi:hypothetical protein|tara:strand:+ start:86 stop:1261 length:1176 start_codon:yes stop_codon:yes gene_type:complete